MCDFFCPNDEKKYQAALHQCKSDKLENWILKSDLNKTCGAGTAFDAASQTCVVACKEGKSFDKAAGECLLDCGDKTLHDGKCLTEDEALADKMYSLMLKQTSYSAGAESEICHHLSNAVCERVAECKNVTKDFIESSALKTGYGHRLSPTSCLSRSLVEMAEGLLELNITSIEEETSQVTANVKAELRRRGEEAMSICPDKGEWQIKRAAAKVCMQAVDAGQDVCDISFCRNKLKLPCENPSQKKRIRGILRNIASDR